MFLNEMLYRYFELSVLSSQEGGQCFCKENTEGRRCDLCKPGFFNLTETNPLGCDACFCDGQGILPGDVTCSLETGACNCKRHVRSKFMIYFLKLSQPMRL